MIKERKWYNDGWINKKKRILLGYLIFCLWNGNFELGDVFWWGGVWLFWEGLGGKGLWLLF